MILIQVFMSGLSLSGYYALLAVGFALIFATLRIFHIAHAAVFAMAGYLVFLVHRVWGQPLLIAVILAVVLAAVGGLLVDRVVYRPVLKKGGGLFSVFIASLGVTLVFESLFLVTSRGNLSVARQGNLEVVSLGILSFRVFDVIVIGLVLALYGLLYFWLMRTRTGLEIRALTDNSGLARIVGVDIARTRVMVFLVASALAGLAGAFTAYDTGMVPDTGSKLLFITMVAVIFGGTHNVLLGSLTGSLILGLITAFAGFFFQEWVTVTVFALLIALLVLRPRGLFG
jgi:branched-subunit amino acid ABC-type transport system permease component